MKRHGTAIFVLSITAIFFVVTGCMKVVKTEDVQKSAEPSTAEQTAQPKEEKVSAGKEEAAGTIKEEKVEEQSIKESSLSAQAGAKAEARDELAATAEKEGILSAIYFDFDSSTVRDDMKPPLDKNTEWLRKRQDAKVQIQGHADERGTNEYNIALGERRAQGIKKYLADSGINEARISTISYGEEKPADPGHTEEAWAKNRRAEFVIIKK